MEETQTRRQGIILEYAVAIFIVFRRYLLRSAHYY